MASSPNRLSEAAAICLGLLAAGCNRSVPDPPPTPAPTEAPSSSTELSDPAPIDAPASAEAPQRLTQPEAPIEPATAAAMAPIANPEDLSPAETARIHGEPAKVNMTAPKVAAASEPTEPVRREQSTPRRDPVQSVTSRTPQPAPPIGAPPPSSSPANTTAAIPKDAQLAALLAVLATAILALAGWRRKGRPRTTPRTSAPDSGLPRARA
jgi:hypothetical protein